MLIAADSPTWTDTGGFWIALAALLFSLGSLIVAWWYGRKSLATAEENVGIAERAAQAARDSADAAKDSARSAADVVQAERERDHRDQQPKVTGAFTTKPDSHATTDMLWYEFTVADRPYRVAGDMVRRNGSRTPLGLPQVVEAGKAVRVSIDNLAMVRGPKQEALEPVESLHLRFWPPASIDPVAGWSCPCGRPIESGGPLHWEVNIPVEVPPDQDVLVFRP